MVKKESTFQTEFKRALEDEFEGCIVLKTMAGFRQGSPDLFMLWGDQWAAFELKRANNAAQQQNQDYYVRELNEMSFAAFVSPENMEEVLDDLHRSLED